MGKHFTLSLFWMLWNMWEVSCHFYNPIEIVFIIDGSAHTNEYQFRHELMLIPSVIEMLPTSDRKVMFGVITYSNAAEIQIGIGEVEDNEALLNRLWKIPKPQSPRSSGLLFALRMTRLHLFSPEGQNDITSLLHNQRFVVIFSNGEWEFPRFTSLEAHLLQKINAQILLICSRCPQWDPVIQVTKKIMYCPSTTMNYVDRKRVFNFIVNNIYNSYEHHKPKTTTTSTTASTSTTTMTTTNSPITEPPFNYTCTMSGELVLIIDASNSTKSEANYQMLLNLVQYLVEIIPPSPNFKIALMSFGDLQSIINYNYEQFNILRNVRDAILSIPLIGGKNSAGSALSTANQKLFNNVLKPNVKRRVVLFLTGMPVVGADPIQVSKVMRRANNITIYGVGVGNEPGMKFVLNEIASETSPSTLVDNFMDLFFIRDNIMKSICLM